MMASIFSSFSTWAEKSVRREITLQAADGARVPALFSAHVVKLEKKMEAIIAVITDLTELKQKERETGKRMKELRAFFHLSRLAEREDFALDDLYRELAHILPESWQYPEIACARIVMGESEFRSANFHLSEWVQAAPVKVHGAVVGKIEVGYLEARPEEDEGPFLKQERQLIDAIAEGVGHITARKRAEDELRKHHIYLEHMVDQRTAQFEAVSLELEGFAYSISHDLRVPMRAIDGFSEMLLKHHADQLDDEGKRYLNLVRDNTKRMNMLFDDILALSRLGRQKITLATIDMEALAREAFEELGPGLAGRELAMEIKPLPPCDGDRAMLRMVWINLLGNAIKFTRPKTPARIEIGGRTEGRERVYYIKDNGVGFDMRYVDKLFGVFQRLHSVEEFEGAGIDLAIVKRIITRHGGRVWAEGKVDEGATFYFALPISSEEQS
jgi:signal transduction histidine kinase